MKNYVDAEKLQEYTTKLVAKLKEIFPGPAQAASTVAEMTDESKVYVYTGSETGYTAGNWYYWNGTAWTSGGVYNAVQIETDTTLTETGEAADAKATGDAIAAAKAAVLADLAPAYSTSATYTVGAYVVYNGGLYRCITAISTAEAWTAAHWTAVNLANDVGASLADLKSAKVNAYTVADMSIANKRIDVGPTPYKVTTQNGNHISDFIPCQVGAKIKVYANSFWYQNNPVAYIVSFYNASKQGILGINQIDGSSATTSQVGYTTATAPANTAYVRFSFSMNDAYYAWIFPPFEITDVEKNKQEANRRIGEIDLINQFEIGGINISASGWSYGNDINRVRTKNGVSFHLYVGDRVGLTDYTNARYYTGIRLTDGTYSLYAWRTSDLTIEVEGDYVFLIANTTDTPQSDYTDLASLFFGYTGVAYHSIEENANDINALKEIRPSYVNGYLTTSGTVAADVIEAEHCVTTDYLPVDNGDWFKLDYHFPTQQSMWVAYCYYDINKKIIGTRTVIVNNVTVTENTTIIGVNNNDAKFIRISYRTYGTITISITSNNPIKELSQRIDDVNRQRLIDIAKLNNCINSVNHRGYSMCPENTIPAFLESRRNGFVIVETDVQFTSDGVAVLMHDATINRTCCNASDGSAISETITISSVEYADLANYDACTPEQWATFKGVKIPRLIDFLALCRAVGLSCYLEVKDGTQAQVEGLVDLVYSYGMAKYCTWIAANPTRLSYINDYDDSARIGYIIQSLDNSAVAFIESIKTAKNEVFADLYYYAADAETSIARAKTEKIPVEVWTINYASTILALDPYITGVTSDNIIAGYLLYDTAIKG